MTSALAGKVVKPIEADVILSYNPLNINHEEVLKINHVIPIAKICINKVKYGSADHLKYVL